MRVPPWVPPLLTPLSASVAHVLAGEQLPKYAYSSAGALHAVRAFVCVPQPDAEGSFVWLYLDPERSELVHVETVAGRTDGQRVHAAIALVVDLDNVLPVYSNADEALNLCLVEAGAMSTAVLERAVRDSLLPPGMRATMQDDVALLPVPAPSLEALGAATTSRVEFLRAVLITT